MTTEEKFNHLCQDIRWSKTNSNFSEIKIGLMKKYTQKELEELENFGRKLSNDLEKAVEVYERENKIELNVGSDDGFSDLRAHIVSEGSESVKIYLQNPKLIESKHDADDYIENFFYCFPYSSDYEMTKLDFYKKVVVQIREEVAKNDVKNISITEEIMLNTILDEISEGIFDTKYDYNNLNKLSQRFGLGSWLSNIWHDGIIFYLKYNSKSAN